MLFSSAVCVCVFCLLQTTLLTSRVINRLWLLLYNSDVNVIIIILVDAAGA